MDSLKRTQIDMCMLILCHSLTVRDETGPRLYDSALTLYSEVVAESVLAEMNKKAKII